MKLNDEVMAWGLGGLAIATVVVLLVGIWLGEETEHLNVSSDRSVGSFCHCNYFGSTLVHYTVGMGVYLV